MSEVAHLWASGEYDAHLEPRPRGPVRRVLVSALDLWCAANGGSFELTRAADVVVRRHDDQREVMRVRVRVADDAPRVLDRVRTELRTQTPESFRRRLSAA